MTAPRRQTALLFAAIFGITLALRLCHSHILWADEDYHMAAGLQTLGGKVLYRDLWYDKPPLAAWLYASLGGLAGWPLRLFDAAYILAICVAGWRFARDLWGEREAGMAAALLAFFLNFYLAPAVIPIAPDLFLLLPHIAAVHCAWRRRPVAAGLWCGVGFLFHTKAVFILAVCALLTGRSLPLLVAGFLVPNAMALGYLAAAGALPEYIRQVWQWGAAYAKSSPAANPWANALSRTAGWLGFHAALLVGAIGFWYRKRGRERWWMGAWLLLSFASVALGMRFFPRYFLHLLPPLVMMWGGRNGLRPRDPQNGVPAAPLEGPFAASCPPSVRWSRVAAVTLALLIPFVRFAPRYFTLAQDLLQQRPHTWNDVALDQDSQAAAALVNSRKHAGDTLFVWGYRPGIFVYTRLPVASRYWDSQPLTGVPADRHLRDATPVLPEQAARNRQDAASSNPTYIVDSLSLSNPRLSLDAYPELRPWLAQYHLVARTPLSLIYSK